MKLCMEISPLDITPTVVHFLISYHQ